VPSGTFPKQDVFRSPRVGLHMTKGASHLETQIKYVYRFYRYFTKPNKIPKGKNLMVLSLHHEGKKADEIARLTGAQAKTVAKHIELYEAGRKKKPEGYAKKLTDDEVSEAIGCLLNL